MCLPMMWTILTAHIREEICYSIGCCGQLTEKQKGCHMRSRGTIIYCKLLNSRWEKRDGNKWNYAGYWLQKVIRYSPAKLNNRLLQNVQDGWQSHKIHHENHERLKSGIDSRRNNVGWDENPEGIFQAEAISPLLFVFAMMSLNHTEYALRSTNLQSTRKKLTI